MSFSACTGMHSAKRDPNLTDSRKTEATMKSITKSSASTSSTSSNHSTSSNSSSLFGSKGGFSSWWPSNKNTNNHSGPKSVFTFGAFGGRL